eukprot:comp22032_c0_seq1/m.31981 comp22032_c0_seq1/g.31981  ORF comp22032_c0_seq1/g.31981 comp22032_c0_seq1/m.31981 type:complete len:752 (-) comp22032_c0_seq1:260-2515(-)
MAGRAPGGVMPGGNGPAVRRRSSATDRPVKKLVIKNFDAHAAPRLPANYESDTWQKLQQAVSAVHASKAVGMSLEELYQMVENLCNHKMAAGLYTKLRDVLDAHICSQLEPLIQSDLNDTDFLTLIDNCWQDHCRHMLMIRSIFLYLDRTYVLQTSGIITLWDLGLHLFLQHIVSNVEVQHKTLAGILQLIETERLGNAVDRSLLKSLLRMLSSLQIYGKVFETPFITASQRFYANEGRQKMQELNVHGYLRHVESRLHEEGQRVLHYLDRATRRPLIHVLEAQLLKPHTGPLLEKGFEQLVDDDRYDDLSLLYSLLGRISAHDEIRTFFAAYVRTKGTALVMNTERDATMVQDLLDFKAKLDRIVRDSFQNNERFRNAVKDALEHVINARPNKPAELIAKFIDSRLRSGNKESSDEELDQLLDNVMLLFRFIQGKDIFEAFYKKDLAKRLLLQKSASADLERSMLSKLKQECGGGFTHKLEGMFKDVDISKDIMVSFEQSKFRNRTSKIELYVNVLTTGQWPTYQLDPEVIIPQEMTKYLAAFREFYLAKHTGRVLNYCHSLGGCTVRSVFNEGVKELSVSFYQALVLLLFNDANELSYESILAKTKIEEGELKRTLQSLACGKPGTRILIKSPKGRDVNAGDRFVFFGDFKHKLTRIKINQIQIKETHEENKETQEQVFQDRQYQVDAAIVRIMKTRKTLSHTLLIAELFEQLKFPIKPQDLKKRIESLIDREYLERDENNSSIYHYLA